MKLEPGSDVFAPWGDGWLYPAVVVRPDPDDPEMVLVAYWEGDAATVPLAHLQPIHFEVGMTVYANHLNRNEYLLGKIERRLGGAVQVGLKNGSTVWTTWAKCRVRAMVVPAVPAGEVS